ncbi:uncharacterized protein KY384_002974 [Bacidia gigantensis]|uniref:uncharacterized protein n=1 Tax=Bacidia gigantensis TaxID=2732470 RepID=UPI001D059412|nr:uncharacterized protein KY384_002974 [Bacidia gigantensis]KAG8531345.1 hypothetical protein KY384_002974 [Bacidia gigantensis]
MAFNFKWSPLAADTSFYTRAQELLTTALNKSPKPPIIVDDIVVNELNLGEIPPDLEVREIGDIDVDRFRGVFKMCYSGNAFMTLKTRVQANPLNTYLSTKPSFTSPRPLAAASGLTIPIQITLSEIKLSAFIILVYSSQKGVTLVFRNDPLESLKVSSTFDAIPFVRDYLQKEIEGQLRTLLMDELPLIIHRLSLRLFNKEYQERDDQTIAQDGREHDLEKHPVDPLASPPQDPVDLLGNVLDPSQIASLSLDPGSEAQTLFSQRNLLRLGALTDSHRTLSLFTPSIKDTVYRAWNRPLERGEMHRYSGKHTPALSRSHSYATSMSAKYNLSTSLPNTPFSEKAPLSTFGGSVATGLSSRHSKPHGKRRKHRVVNLRKKVATGEEMELESVSGDSTTNSYIGTDSADSAPLEFVARPRTPEIKEPGDADVGQTPPRLKEHTTPRPPPQKDQIFSDDTPRQSQYLPPPPSASKNQDHPARRPSLAKSQTYHTTTTTPQAGKNINISSKTRASLSSKVKAEKDPQPLTLLDPSPFVEDEKAESSDPAPQSQQEAWMSRIADEILRKVHEQKRMDSGFWRAPSLGGSEELGEGEPPPAYGS